MHKKVIIIVISILLLLCAALNSCQNSEPTPDTPSQTTTSPYDIQIKELQDKIQSLQQSQTLSDEESRQQIAELEAEIEKLRAESSTVTTTQTTATQTTPAPRSVFIYSLEDGKAISR